MASVVNRLDAQVFWAAVPEWVLYSKMSDRAVRLYGILARRANANDQCFPSRRHLADAMGCSASSVDRALEELVSAGAVAVQPQFRDGRQTVNLYTVLAMSSPVTTPLVTRDDGEVVTGDEQNDSHRNESHNTLAAAPRERKPRPKDELFEALARLGGHQLDRLTSSERGRINKAAQMLREVQATPEQVDAAARIYRTRFPQAALTATALAANWSTIQPPPKAKAFSQTNWCPKCGTDADAEYHEELCDAYVAYN